MAQLTVPLAAPEIGEAERRYVEEALATGWISSAGPLVERFENAVAQRMGAAHAVATNCGTSALHAALLAAGVRPDDEVIVSAFTFIAPANAIRYAGAWPVFVDPEPQFWQIDPNLVEDFLGHACERDGTGCLRNRRTGRPVTAIVAVDVLGHPVDWRALKRLARDYGLIVVEDAAESLGAEYLDGDRGWVPVGSLADVAVTSFNGNKTITAGAGGMIVTSDPRIADRARYLTTQARDPGIEFIHGAIGFNYRLSNVHAGIGLGQVERIDALIDAKRRIADRYAESLSGVPGIALMRQASWARSTFWLYTVLIDPEIFGMTSRGLIERLLADGIGCQPRWQALYDSPAYAGAERVGPGVAADLHAQGISLPCSVSLTAEDQDRVIAAIRLSAET